MIVPTTDWRRLVSETGHDLHTWTTTPIDWPRTLAQPNWHLITDKLGSWCLLEPVSPVYAADQHHHMEAHLIIAPTSRGKRGLGIARAMLDWIATEVNPRSLIAKVSEPKTALFLRWVGFELDQDEPRVMRFRQNCG